MHFNATSISHHGSCVLSAHHIYNANLTELESLQYFLKQIIKSVQYSLTVFLHLDHPSVHLSKPILLYELYDGEQTIEGSTNGPNILESFSVLYSCLVDLYYAYPHIRILILPLTTLEKLSQKPPEIDFSDLLPEKKLLQPKYPDLLSYYKTFTYDENFFVFFLPNEPLLRIISLDPETCQKLNLHYLVLDLEVNTVNKSNSKDSQPPHKITSEDSLENDDNLKLPPNPSNSKYKAIDSKLSICFSGTFDHLHLGHMYILISICQLPIKHLFLGITVEQMLSKKENKKSIEPFLLRLIKMADYLNKVFFYINKSSSNYKLINPEALGSTNNMTLSYDGVYFFELNNPLGPALDTSSFSTLVVTDETRKMGKKINDLRCEMGRPSLNILLFSCLPVSSKNYGALNKFSSTSIRQNLGSTTYFDILYDNFKNLKTIENYTRLSLWWILLNQYELAIRLRNNNLSMGKSLTWCANDYSSKGFEEIVQNHFINLGLCDENIIIDELRLTGHPDFMFYKTTQQLLCYFIHPPSKGIIENFKLHKESMDHSESVFLALLLLYSPGKRFILPYDKIYTYFTRKSKSSDIDETSTSVGTDKNLETLERASLLISLFDMTMKSERCFTFIHSNKNIELYHNIKNDYLWLQDLCLNELFEGIYKVYCFHKLFSDILLHSTFIHV